MAFEPQNRDIGLKEYFSNEAACFCTRQTSGCYDKYERNSKRKMTLAVAVKADKLISKQMQKKDTCRTEDISG